MTNTNIENPLAYDVVIAGAGLVGATLAAQIASENTQITIAIIDQGVKPLIPDLKQHAPCFDSRVVALTHASIQIFQNIGIWPDVIKKRACPYRHMTVWDDEGTGEIHFNADELGQSALGYIVENALLLTAVLDAISDLPNITVLHQHTIEKIDYSKQPETALTIYLSDDTALSSQLLIGADGAHSRIRKLIDVPICQWDYRQKAIVTTVKTERPHCHTAWQNFLITGPLAFLPLDHKSEQYCSIVWSLDTEHADKKMALADQHFCQALERSSQACLGRIEYVDKRLCFPLIQRHVRDYFVPQVALVGDAAHTIHPLAGQGVNLGLLDAQALAQELLRAYARQLPLHDQSILRRYQRKRKQNNMAMMALMAGFKHLFAHSSLPIRLLRNSGLKTVNTAQPIKKWLARQAMGI
ncbi:MAG: UbiH/UbiF/VisC/COQ6 family ubiquinone biosynthesis hydroxylase [Pseudomonadota bacterium]